MTVIWPDMLALLTDNDGEDSGWPGSGPIISNGTQSHPFSRPPFPQGGCLSDLAAPAYDGAYMNINFACPQCDQSVRADVRAQDEHLECPHCGLRIDAPVSAFDGDELRRCLVCPSTDLFVRKDFPQRLGVGLVVLGIIASSITWGYSYPIATFAILFATALADVVLYLVVPDALMCYRCGAQYRMADGMERHGDFSLETHERHRQQAARMAGGRKS